MKTSNIEILINEMQDIASGKGRSLTDKFIEKVIATAKEELAEIKKYEVFTLTSFTPEPIFSEHVIWLMLDGAKTTGDWLEGLQYHGEEYTHEEYANAESFLKWIKEKKLTAGRANIQERIDQWLDEVPRKDENDS